MREREGRNFIITIAFLAAINYMGLVFFFADRWNHHVFDGFYILEKTVLFSLVLCIFGLVVMAYFKKAWGAKVLIININIFICGVLLITINMFFSLFPSFLPQSLVRLNPQLYPNLKQVRLDVLGYLNESPWVKFKPNTDIDLKIIGNKGDDFTHYWTTDQLGFKNRAGLAESREFTALAIGDSFTEGMGVPIDKTWESLLVDGGFQTYSLGVEGYSPQQAVGALKKYGSNFKAKFIIFGYTPGFETRALNFEGDMPSNLQSKSTIVMNFSQFNSEQKYRQERHFKVINSFLDIFYIGLDSLKYKYPILFSSGASRLETRVGAPVQDQEKALTLTLNSIIEAKKIAYGMNARMIILLFSHSNDFYLGRSKILLTNQTEDRKRLAERIELFAKENDMGFIDTYPVIKQYIDNLSEPRDPLKLPYFKFDGHMNEIGHKLTAQIVQEFLKKIGR